MKATFNNPVLRAAVVAVVVFISTTVQAQTGTVWTRIADLSSLELTQAGDAGLSSKNTAVQHLIADLDVVSIKKAFTATRTRSLTNVYEITCNCNENDLLAEVAKLSTYFQSPELVTAPQALFTPNDFSTSVANDYALNLINAKQAWDVTRGDSAVVIAITDGNFYLSHEDLMGKFNYVGLNASTDYAHGTAVAVTAAGKTNNGTGKSAIGYNSTLQLRAMTYNDVLEASYSGARIVNMSWTSGCYFNAYAQAVIDEAYANGTILVASAGNGGTCGAPTNLVYPAAYDHVIAVSSVGLADNHERFIGDPASTHQHNASVDICAPGYDVALTTAPGVYLTGNGTSFAAPYVSGTLALMLSVNPCLTPEQAELILKTTAVNIDAINPSYAGLLGAGRLDAAAAVRMAATYSTTALHGEQVVECSTMAQGLALDMSTIAAPYSILWNTGATTATLENVTAGDYSVIVRDANGCVGYFTARVDALVPMDVTAAIHPVVCHGANTGSILTTALGGNEGYSYLWNTGATTATLNGVAAGQYTVTVTDSKGCNTNATFTVTEPQAMTAVITMNDAFTPNDATLDVTVNGGVAPYNYTWNNGATTEDLNGLGEGFYELLITDANGCQTSANAVVNDQTITEHTAVNTELATGTETGTTEVAGIEQQQNNIETGVYPNPATDHATVTWAGATAEMVQVLNMQGQLIQTVAVTPAMNDVTLTGIATGEYMVRVITTNNQQKVQRVIFL